MSARNLPRSSRQSGQTLIVALLVLGILLILGTVFLGFISRGITTAARGQQRTVATDLAEAGVRYAHAQLLDSELGADWRPPVTLNPSPRDPDYNYLVPAGPDNLGGYSRVDFANGRVLIRVRYAPSDSNIFAGSPTGNLRTPGRVRGYLVIEAVGRSGAFNPGDPTSAVNREKGQERKLIAFASIGLIDQARFIVNKFNVSRAADLGIPIGLGAVMGSVPVNNLELQMGGTGTVPRQVGVPQVGVGYGAGLRANCDLTIHGLVTANLNTYLGDQWVVAGGIQGADNTAVLQLNIVDYNKGTNNYVNRPPVGLQNGTNPSLNSRGNFFTFGVLRDGFAGTDPDGVSRGARKLEAPSTLRTDPQSGRTHYVLMTRESGVIGAAGNNGRFGYGRNIYIDNITDRQIRPDAGGRADLGTGESLVYDWLNPNNGGANTGWKGPFYVPTGAFLQLFSDGFGIVRNAQAINPAERTWKLPDGTDTGTASIRYRIGAVNGQPYIVNTFTPGVNINGALGIADYAKGQPFGGVLYFEGNVRVRGIIPTDLQLTVVSGATIYIEGSITKGLRGNDYTGGVGALLTRPSRSMLMLMAKEYVAVNTTQFVGSAAGQQLDVKDSDTLSAIRMVASSSGLSLRTELILNADSNLMPASASSAVNPASWMPFSNTYVMSPKGSGTLTPVAQNLMLMHAMDDSGGAAPASFMSIDVNFGVDNLATGHTNDWNFLFPLSTFNAALPYQGNTWVEPNHTTAGLSIVEGLGGTGSPWQRYPKFETLSLPFIDSSFNYSTARFDLEGTDAGLSGSFVGLLQDTTDISFRPNNQFGVGTADYLLARAAVTPLDVRIEASVYAEEGSFFVIPGPAFNSNPNDRRDVYEANVLAYEGPPSNLTAPQARDAADNDRLNNYGSFPTTPFYGEPLDIKINIVGSVSENMPPPMSQQAEWLKRWGWIPRKQGAERIAPTVDREIPIQHFPGLLTNDVRYDNYVPNIVITYDPALAAGRVMGFDNTYTYLRTDSVGRALPPMPRLPVSPTLSYFGEVNP